MNVLKTSGAIVRSIALASTLTSTAFSGSAIGVTNQVAVKGRANAYASLAAEGRFVVLAWGASTADGVTDIYAATSTDGGRTFAGPGRVNQAPGDASLSGEQPPRVTLIPRVGQYPAVVVVWTAKASPGTRLLSARSDDFARSFTAPVRVPGCEAAGNRGW